LGIHRATDSPLDRSRRMTYEPRLNFIARKARTRVTRGPPAGPIGCPVGKGHRKCPPHDRWTGVLPPRARPGLRGLSRFYCRSTGAVVDKNDASDLLFGSHERGSASGGRAHWPPKVPGERNNGRRPRGGGKRRTWGVLGRAVVRRHPSFETSYPSGRVDRVRGNPSANASPGRRYP
jgi:hypothetical protein